MGGSELTPRLKQMWNGSSAWIEHIVYCMVLQRKLQRIYSNIPPSHSKITHGILNFSKVFMSISIDIDRTLVRK